MDAQALQVWASHERGEYVQQLAVVEREMRQLGAELAQAAAAHRTSPAAQHGLVSGAGRQTSAAQGRPEEGGMLSVAVLRHEAGQCQASLRPSMRMHQHISQRHCKCGRQPQQLPALKPLCAHGTE